MHAGEPIAPRLTRATWWLVAGLVIALNLAGLGARLARVAPLNPWEPAIACDAWRAAHGRAVHADPLLDHATVMYGPLWPHLLGGLIRLGAPDSDLRLARGVVLAAALLLVGGLWRACAHPGLPPLAAPALLLAPNLPCASYYVEARPDLPALLCAAAALWLLARGQVAGRRGTWAWGVALLLLAGALKQTMLAAGAVPLLAALLGRAPRGALAWALPPLGAALLAPLVTALGAPWVHHYAFVVPAAYPLRPGAALLALLEGASRAPLPLALLVLALARGRAARGPARAWTLAALLVAWPVAAVSSTRAGGDANSHLPLLLAAAVWSCPHLATAWRAALRAGRPLAAALLALLLLLGALRDPVRAWHFARVAAHGDATRPAAIQAARRLPGRGACPDDPALLLAAGGEPGRSLVAEKDADGWRARTPPGVVQELSRAEWVITVRGSWPRAGLHPEVLRGLGFVPRPLGGGASAAYGLWRRADDR